MGHFEIVASNVRFVIDSEDREGAVDNVEGILGEYAVDWSTLVVND